MHHSLRLSFCTLRPAVAAAQGLRLQAEPGRLLVAATLKESDRAFITDKLLDTYVQPFRLLEDLRTDEHVQRMVTLLKDVPFVANLGSVSP